MNRRRYVWLAGIATALLLTPAVIPMTPRLVWNASASVPIGLYTVHAIERPAIGDLVAYTPPADIDRFMVERGYIGAGVPLLKHIAGLPGQTVCRRGSTISVDGVALGDALDRDRLGRDLPVWQGCRRIATGDIFLMNAAVRDSLDGRYFGPLPRDHLVGTLRPVWTETATGKPFAWYAAPIRAPR
ncbi:peptidase S26 [Aureimonas ureilytica]|uniref:Peptidase S26 n=1 Tax=Aureimonas ureilytica TaxID=401562 RepID=A0A175RBX2_9HYPH|nr:S26 family signal peptidase [Aureimonas ureilytica]KTQ96343.1 peptidase S26 [Aureimonas ureilytica]